MRLHVPSASTRVSAHCRFWHATFRTAGLGREHTIPAVDAALVWTKPISNTLRVPGCAARGTRCPLAEDILRVIDAFLVGTKPVTVHVTSPHALRRPVFIWGLGRPGFCRLWEDRILLRAALWTRGLGTENLASVVLA